MLNGVEITDLIISFKKYFNIRFISIVTKFEILTSFITLYIEGTLIFYQYLSVYKFLHSLLLYYTSKCGKRTPPIQVLPVPGVLYTSR